MSIALVSPLVLYWLIERTGWGRFLFERPAWAHIPGTPGSRGYVEPTAVQPGGRSGLRADVIPPRQGGNLCSSRRGLLDGPFAGTPGARTAICGSALAAATKT